jgi:hypothetical protein
VVLFVRTPQLNGTLLNDVTTTSSPDEIKRMLHDYADHRWRLQHRYSTARKRHAETLMKTVTDEQVKNAKLAWKQVGVWQ